MGYCPKFAAAGSEPVSANRHINMKICWIISFRRIGRMQNGLQIVLTSRQKRYAYLSMIRDLYDNSIVSYKTASQQTVNLVLDTIRLAMKKGKVAAELQLHSDQGFQYTSQAYFKLTQSYGITPSMPRKGNPYDNAMAEKFFSILKAECIYRHKTKTRKKVDNLIDRYIRFYNHERIQTKAEWHRWRCATPLKTKYFLHRCFFVSSV